MMQDSILVVREEDNSGRSDLSSRPSKLAKANVPVGMALVAQQLATAVDGITALSAQFHDNGKPEVRTRADKAHAEREAAKGLSTTPGLV
eukprot:3817313-Rhodomonas_salina.1